MTFINKLDREGRNPIDLLDEVESVLGIQCAPVTWPIGMGSRLKGVVHLVTGEVHLYEQGRNFTRQDSTIFTSLDDPQLEARIGDEDAARSCATSWNWCRAPRIRSIATPTWPASRRRCSSARRSTISACSRCSISSSNTRPRRGRAKPPRREVAPDEDQAQRLRVQDPGQHGPDAPRPRRVHARLLGHVRRRHEGAARAHRQGSETRQRADLHGQRPRDRRDGVAGRRDRHPQPRHDLDRRHASPKARRSASPASPTSRRNCSAARACAIRSSSSSCRKAWRS